MFGWYERGIQRRLQRWHVRVLCRLHPELLSIGDEKDRAWAFWYAAAGRTPAQRFIATLCTLLIGPITTAGALLALVGALGWTWHMHWSAPLIVGLLGGAIAGAIFVEAIRGGSIRRRYFRAMRIAGHDVCGQCGYDMTGHPASSDEPRICPECGRGVAVQQSRTHLRTRPQTLQRLAS